MDTKRKNYMTLAERFYQEGEQNKAISMYKKALSFQGTVEDECLILFNLGAIYLEQGKLDEAKEFNRKILSLNTSIRDVYYQLGIISEEEDNLDESLDYYSMAIQLEPDDIDSRYNLALIYERLGNPEETEKLYHEILELEPNHWYTLNNLGAMEETRGNYELARAYLDKSIEENPEFYLSRFNRGVVLKALGELDKAVEEYTNAKDLRPDFGNTYLNISAIRIEQDRLDEAVDILSEGIRNSTSTHDLYYNRACCLSKLGRKAESLHDLDSALKLNPYLAVWVRRDKDFESLKEEPIFIDILNKAMEAIQKGR